MCGDTPTRNSAFEGSGIISIPSVILTGEDRLYRIYIIETVNSVMKQVHRFGLIGGLATVLAILGTTGALPIASVQTASAATVFCNGVPTTIVGTSGSDDIEGTAGADVIASLGGDDKVRGRGGNDTICGGGGNDDLGGDSGNDTIFGNSGNDKIRGESGNDRLNGGSGNDNIRGDLGTDRANGADGFDDCRAETVLNCEIV